MNAGKREFVDTNILVYAYDRSHRDKHSVAGKLLEKLWKDRTGCLSVQVLQEFYVTVTKKVVQPISPREASGILTDLGTWVCHAPSVSDLVDAIGIQEKYKISFWDCLIIHSAMKLGSNVIWSEDLNPGQYYQGIQIVNPFLPNTDYPSFLSETEGIFPPCTE